MFLHLVNIVIQKSILLADPWYFLRVVGNTLWIKQEYFIQGSIGVLGWMDTPLPPIVYYGFIMVFGIILIKTVESTKQSIPLGLLIFVTGISCGTIMMMMVFFYLRGTPVAYPVVDSMQGRYVLPVLPFLILLLSGWGKIAIQHRKITFTLLGLLLLGLFLQSIFYRYYDYSRVFDTADLLLPQEKELQDGKIVETIGIEHAQYFTYETKYPGYKIGGFQMLVNVNVNRPATIPYRFEMRTGDCSRSIRSGYLDQTELHRPHIYTQIIPITPISERSICLGFVPLFQEPGMQHLLLAARDGKPIVNFLYLKK